MHKLDATAVVAIRLVACGLLGVNFNPFEGLAEEHGHYMDELPEEHGTWSDAVLQRAEPQVRCVS